MSARVYARCMCACCWCGASTRVIEAYLFATRGVDVHVHTRVYARKHTRLAWRCAQMCPHIYRSTVCIWSYPLTSLDTWTCAYDWCVCVCACVRMLVSVCNAFGSARLDADTRLTHSQLRSSALDFCYSTQCSPFIQTRQSLCRRLGMCGWCAILLASMA